VILDMRLGRFPRVVSCVTVVTASQVGVVAGGFEPPAFVVFRSFLVMTCRLFVMLRRLTMMFRCFLRQVFPCPCI
jgi:hypothetical protein